jgi:hypothetical protein
MADDRRGRKSTYLNGKGTPAHPGDEQGAYSLDQLMRMDTRCNSFPCTSAKNCDGTGLSGAREKSFGVSKA